MMRSVKAIFLLSFLAPFGADASAYRHSLRPPTNVRVLARHTTLGAASPDGRFFAYTKPALVIERTRNGRTFRRLNIKHLQGGLAWSQKGRFLAFDARNWKKGAHKLYRYDLRRSKLQVVTRKHARQFVFTPRGRLIYLTGDGAYVAWKNVQIWRMGEPRPFLRLPNRGLTAPPYRQVVRLHRRHVLTIAHVKDPRHRAPAVEIWLTSLANGRARRVYSSARSSGSPHRKAHSPLLSPAEDRLCYLSGSQARCIELSTGADQVVVQSPERCPVSFGPKARPFSPNGRFLAVMGCAGSSSRALIVHDFVTGLNRTLLRATRFKGFRFQGNRHVILSRRDHWKLSYRYVAAPAVDKAVARIHVETGAYEVLVADDTENQIVATVPGNTRVLYVTRGRDSTEDLCRANISRPWRAPKARPRRRSGRFTQYHANGRPKLRLTYRNGKAHGVLKRWYWSGRILETGRYVAGVPVGIWTTYDPQGKVFIRRTLRKGKMHGPRTTYIRYSGRTTRKVAHFANNALSGRQTYYNHRGRPVLVMHWRANRKHGRYTTYDGRGGVVIDGLYVNGKKHGPWRLRNGKIQHYRHGRRYSPHSRTNH